MHTRTSGSERRSTVSTRRHEEPCRRPSTLLHRRHVRLSPVVGFRDERASSASGAARFATEQSGPCVARTPRLRPCCARCRPWLHPARNLPARGGGVIPDALLAGAARGIGRLDCGHLAAGQRPRRGRTLARIGGARTGARFERRARTDELSRSADDRRARLARRPALGRQRHDGIDPHRLSRDLGERSTAKLCSEQDARLRARGRCRPHRCRLVRSDLADTGACGDRPRSEPEAGRSDGRARCGSHRRGSHVSGADLRSPRGSLPQCAAGRSALQSDLASPLCSRRSGSTWRLPSTRSTSPSTETSPRCTGLWPLS